MSCVYAGGVESSSIVLINNIPNYIIIIIIAKGAVGWLQQTTVLQISLVSE